MFSKVIRHLESEIRNYRTLASDNTGVLTEGSKKEYLKNIEEFQAAVSVLKSKSAFDLLKQANEAHTGNYVDSWFTSHKQEINAIFSGNKGEN